MVSQTVKKRVFLYDSPNDNHHNLGDVDNTAQVNPLQWGPSKIRFRSTDSLDELLLVIAFIIKHSLEVPNDWGQVKVRDSTESEGMRQYCLNV